MNIRKGRLIGCLLIAMSLVSMRAFAQETPSPAANAPDQAAAGLSNSVHTAPLPAVTADASSAGGVASTPATTSGSLSGLNLALYAGYGIIQALDAHSTMRALDSNGTEANPLIRSLASSPAGLISFKAATSVGVLYFMERLRRKNRTAALALAIGVNSAQALVVMHNYRVARR